jgi:hypothetical protein
VAKVKPRPYPRKVKPDGFSLESGKWWYSDGMRSYVFANQWNTIIEISFISEYDLVKSLLLETVAEISDRIDALSQ